MKIGIIRLSQDLSFWSFFLRNMLLKKTWLRGRTSRQKYSNRFQVIGKNNHSTDYVLKWYGTMETFITKRSRVDFINVQITAFMLVGPKSVRIQSSSQYLFTLLGSTNVKAARRMLMKLTPDLVLVLTLRRIDGEQKWTLRLTKCILFKTRF